jgi:hypothetical protein
MLAVARRIVLVGGALAMAAGLYAETHRAPDQS